MSKPLEAAVAEAEQFAIQPTSLLRYQSSGRLLIIGTAQQVLSCYKALHTLTITLLLTEPCDKQVKALFTADDIRLIKFPDSFQIAGYLGNFTLELADIPEPNLSFDLILDLQQSPTLKREILPIGYYAPENFHEDMHTILQVLPEMSGEFDKPKFFNLDQQKCAHSNSGLTGCRQCLDACAAAAIESVDNKITVNAYLCQGCGDCSTVCPSGAINYAFPNRQDTLNRLRKMLGAFFAARGKTPVVLLHDQQCIAPPAEFIIPYQVEALASTGMEIWFSILAYGASQVYLLNSGKLTELSRKNLTTQVEIAQAILQGMDYSTQLIKIINYDSIPALPVQGHSRKPASFTGIADKRQALRIAVDHLLQNVPEQQPSVALPANSPCGAIHVDTHHCTLCLSCVSICPAGALQDGQNIPQLKFIESLCVQCGLCQTACPEKVISLQPRYVYHNTQAMQPVLLHEENVFHCVSCGEPFATEKMIKSICEKLQNHPMFQGKSIQQLKMCDQCRVTSQFDSK